MFTKFRVQEQIALSIQIRFLLLQWSQNFESLASFAVTRAIRTRYSPQNLFYDLQRCLDGHSSISFRPFLVLFDEENQETYAMTGCLL